MLVSEGERVELQIDPDTGDFWLEAGFGTGWVHWTWEDDETIEAHVIPHGDTGSHIATEHCKCRPQMDAEGVWLHWAYDGRDAYDEKKRRPH